MDKIKYDIETKMRFKFPIKELPKNYLKISKRICTKTVLGYIMT